MQINHTTRTDLCEIMTRFGSDKGNGLHNYTTFYAHAFGHIRTHRLRIFELGLGTNNINLPSNMGKDGKPGASLYGWREYFPNSLVFGADIDTDILFSYDRLRTYYCDQTDPASIAEMWAHPDLAENFDIIVEDGLHTFLANVCFLENSLHKLKENGFYIVEDIHNDQIHLFEAKIKEWQKRYTYSFQLLRMPSEINRQDNNLLIVRNPAGPLYTVSKTTTFKTSKAPNALKAPKAMVKTIVRKNSVKPRAEIARRRRFISR